MFSDVQGFHFNCCQFHPIQAAIWFFSVPPDLVHLLGESSSVYVEKKSCFDGNINTFLHGEYTILDAKKVMFDGKKKHFAWIQTACKLVKTKTIQQKNALN